MRSASAEEIMLAIGRDPHTASLDLDKAGVATEHGRILAAQWMRTSTPHTAEELAGRINQCA